MAEGVDALDGEEGERLGGAVVGDDGGHEEAFKKSVSFFLIFSSVSKDKELTTAGTSHNDSSFGVWQSIPVSCKVVGC